MRKGKRERQHGKGWGWREGWGQRGSAAIKGSVRFCFTSRASSPLTGVLFRRLGGGGAVKGDGGRREFCNQGRLRKDGALPHRTAR